MTKRSMTIEDLLRLHVVADPQFSPDGRRVVCTVKQIDPEKNRYWTHLWLADLDSGQVRQFTQGQVQDNVPRWSPDGSRIAFTRTRDKQTRLWLMPADGGEAAPLTHLPEGQFGAPTWSPDGQRLAFAFLPTHPDWTQEARKQREKSGRSNPPRIITRLHYRLDGVGFLDARSHIWVCDAATGQARQITSGEYDDVGPAWSPDGQWLAFAANRSDDPETRPYEVDLWLVSPNGGDLRRIPTPIGSKGFAPENLSWSPDSQTIAYIGAEAGDDPWITRHDRLWVVPVSDGAARCLTGDLDRVVAHATLSDTHEAFGSQPAYWSRDSQRLFFLASEHGSTHLYTVPVAGGRPEPLTSGPIHIVNFTADRATEHFVLLLGQPTQPPELFLGTWSGSSGVGLEYRPLTAFNQPWLAEVQVSTPEEFWFHSTDGANLQGWLLKPPGFDPTLTYPLLLYVHGGPMMQYGHAFFHEFQVYAARGYVVFYTNPRGSMGYDEQFVACIRGNWGDLDYQDIMAAADFAASLPYIDAARMAIAGGSYGGFMTNWVIGHSDRFRCAVTDRSVVNFHSDFGTCDFPGDIDGYWPGDAWDRPEKLWQQSPLRFAAAMHTPLLIIHSEGDLRCPIEQAEQLFVALKRLKREVVFVRYPLETSHSLSRTGPPDLRLDRLQRIAEWLDQHLQSG